MRVCGPASSPVGWNCTISMSRSGKPARSAIASPSHALSPEGVWYLYIVGPPPVARTTARARASTSSPVRMSSSTTPAMRSPVARAHQFDRAMLLEPPDAARPDLLREAVDDLDAGEIALVHRAVERLPGERLLVDGAVRIAIEEAAELVLQLVDALDRARHELPRELLVAAATRRPRSCP